MDDHTGALKVSRKVADYNMNLYGEDSMEFARALMNVGTAAGQVGKDGRVLSEAAYLRALRITMDETGEYSADTTRVFAKLVQAQHISTDDKPKGIKQKEFMKTYSASFEEQEL